MKNTIYILIVVCSFFASSLMGQENTKIEDENGRTFTNAAPTAAAELPTSTEEKGVVPEEDPNATIFERQDEPIDREAYAFRTALQGKTATSDLGTQALNQRLENLESQINLLRLENQALKRRIEIQGAAPTYFSSNTGSDLPDIRELPAGKSASVKVYDKKWNLVKEIQISRTENSTIDPSMIQLPAALYILVLVIDNVEADYKVINFKGQ